MVNSETILTIHRSPFTIHIAHYYLILDPFTAKNVI
jgi:hypothetical protein